MKRDVYITATGKFYPGEPVSNEAMEGRLGKIGGVTSLLRERVLKQNRIEKRYYAIDDEQRTQYSNAEMAARAVQDAVQRAGMELADFPLLVAATSQGDLPLPGFASMVHGELQMPPCEIATLHGICASSVAGLRHASMAIKADEVPRALSVASEFPSRLLKASRYEAQGYGPDKRLPFESEFLRWMLSDGAGAFVLQNEPSRQGLSLQIESITLKSYASQYPPCMFVGNKEERENSPAASVWGSDGIYVPDVHPEPVLQAIPKPLINGDYRSLQSRIPAGCFLTTLPSFPSSFRDRGKFALPKRVSDSQRIVTT